MHIKYTCIYSVHVYACAYMYNCTYTYMYMYIVLHTSVHEHICTCMCHSKKMLSTTCSLHHLVSISVTMSL